MDSARSTLVIVALAGATLAAAVFGPAHGSPDPAIMIAVLFASLTSGIAGFAFSAICGGILNHLWEDNVRIVHVMIACSLVNQAAMVWTLRGAIIWRSLTRLVVFSALGVPVGAVLLRHLDRLLYAHAIGALLLLYGAAALVLRNRSCALRLRWAEAPIGFIGGMIGASAALPSLPITLLCQLRGLDKDAQRALVQPFVLVTLLMSLLAMPVLLPSASGAFDPADLLCIPPALFGNQIGLGLRPQPEQCRVRHRRQPAADRFRPELRPVSPGLNSAATIET